MKSTYAENFLEYLNAQGIEVNNEFSLQYELGIFTDYFSTI